MPKQEILKAVERGKRYLLSKINNGLCQEDFGLRHGLSLAWTTACVGSTLAEFGIVLSEMFEAVLALQKVDGGWAYNENVPPDTDTTLRVVQFLRKQGQSLASRTVLKRAENFILAHQRADGGFATFSRDAVEDMMGYESSEGWASSHLCVTALAVNQLTNEEAILRARRYLCSHIQEHGFISYWWRTPFYLLYEMGVFEESPLIESDTIELALVLLLKAKLGKSDNANVEKLVSFQDESGRFRPSRQLRIPFPNQKLDELDGSERVVEDREGMLSTCAAVVALSRQVALIK